APDESRMDVEADPGARGRTDPPGPAPERGADGRGARPGGLRRPPQREGLRRAGPALLGGRARSGLDRPARTLRFLHRQVRPTRRTWGTMSGMPGRPLVRPTGWPALLAAVVASTCTFGAGSAAPSQK